MKLNNIFLGIGIFLGMLAQAQFTQYNIVKEVQTKKKGVVVSAHPLASEAGIKMLNKGGNAFDVAIATQWALAVVYPQAGNIGGGGFMVATTSKGEKFTLDYRETAPKNARRDMYIIDGKTRTELSQYGGLSAGVPGSVAGLYATLPYAKLPMKTLIQPAIDLAEKGFAITQAEANLLNQKRQEFLDNNIKPTPFVKNNQWEAGDILVQKDLAKTLRRIQKYGQREFYEGETAKLIASEMKNNKGIITLEDLKNYRVKFRKPLIFEHKGYQIITMPLPSSGGILLNQMLSMSRLASLEQYQALSPEAVQIMVEAERRAYADRSEYMGDPDFVQDNTTKLIDPKYIESRWSSFDKNQATPSASVGKTSNSVPEKEQTTHISILDKEGNAISITTTLNGYYGSKTVVSGAGFLLNNEMDDFSIKPGVPNLYGAIGGEANAIAPKKRMLSSMTPTIILKDGKTFMVVGTPGGTTIPTSVYQAITGVIDFKLPPTLVINQPRFHHQWLPEKIFIEKYFPKTTINTLSEKKYTFEERSNIGKLELILIDEKGNIIAIADRREADSVGVEE
jgi:gamma-glutamyltransferase